MLEQAIGAPFRQLVSGVSQGEPFKGLSRATNQIFKDPQTAPSYDSILAKLGMEEGGLRTGTALAMNLLEPGIPGAGMAKMGKLPGMMGSVKKVAKTLPMDELSKLRRAKEMGFDTKQVLTHQTDAVFDEFKSSKGGMFGPGVYFFRDKIDGGNFGERAIHAYAKRGKMLDIEAHDTPKKIEKLFKDLGLPNTVMDEAIARGKKILDRLPADIERMKGVASRKGKTVDPENIKRLIVDQTKRSKDVMKYKPNAEGWLLDAIRDKYPDADHSKKLVELLQKHGYTGKKALWNGQDIDIIFEPKNIRDITAKFDPSKADSTKLMAGGLGAVDKKGLAGVNAARKADNILQKISSPEKAGKLKGKAREEYLEALTEKFGPVEQRAKKMGFGDKDYYHGTKTDFDKFDINRLGDATTADRAKKAIFATSSPGVATDYAYLAPKKIKTEFIALANKVENYEKSLRNKISQEMFGKNGSDLNLDDWKSVSKKVELDPTIIENRKKMKELLPKYTGDKGYNKVFTKDESIVMPLKFKNPGSTKNLKGGRFLDEEGVMKEEIGGGTNLFKNVDDDVLSEMISSKDPRVSDIITSTKPKDIRSKYAAFDPRFKDSPILMSGGLGALSPEMLKELMRMRKLKREEKRK